MCAITLPTRWFGSFESAAYRRSDQAHERLYIAQVFETEYGADNGLCTFALHQALSQGVALCYNSLGAQWLADTLGRRAQVFEHGAVLLRDAHARATPLELPAMNRG